MSLESIDALLDLDERLHGYQLRGVQHLWEKPHAGLFLEMGLGKTATVLQALTPDHLPALVVGPKRVAEHVWPAEVAKWRPDLTIAVAEGPVARRREALASGSDIVAIGVANLKDAKPGWKTIVFDELSLFKSHESQRWNHAKRLARFTPYVWGLTGTPAPNGLLDLWAQMYLLDQGERLGHGKRWGTGITQYKERWFVPDFNGFGFTPREGAQAEIQNRIADICLSMRAEDYLELPPATYNTVQVTLPKKAMDAYESMREHLLAEITEDENVLAANAAVKLGKLAQITAGFLYDEDKTVHWLHDEKVDAVREIVDGTGSPVLVFYRFIAELEALQKAIPQARTIKDPGVVDEWIAGRVPVLLAHPASTGHGLNLQGGGHTIVWPSLDFSAERWQQANARLVRQGQTKPVVIHVLEAAEVDRQIRFALEGKVSVQDAVMAALDNR